jgi:hypothetical protein
MPPVVGPVLPQPDYPTLAAGLRQVVTQIERIPNIPNPGQEIKTLSDLIKDLTTKIDEMKHTLDDVQTSVRNIEQVFVSFFYVHDT